MTDPKRYGVNVEVLADEDGDLLIRIRDFRNANHGPSKSGKTITVASTKGNIDFEGVKLGLNCYRYPKG